LFYVRSLALMLGLLVTGEVHADAPGDGSTNLADERRDCATFGGRFSYFGQAGTTHQMGKPVAIDAMFGRMPRRDARFALVSYVSDRHMLRIEIPHGDQPSDRSQFETEAQCDGGQVTVHFIHAGSSDGTWVRDDRVISLAIANDGAMIARMVGTLETGLILRSKKTYDLTYRYPAFLESRERE
jgi:hypothetical protein